MRDESNMFEMQQSSEGFSEAFGLRADEGAVQNVRSSSTLSVSTALRHHHQGIVMKDGSNRWLLTGYNRISNMMQQHLILVSSIC